MGLIDGSLGLSGPVDATMVCLRKSDGLGASL